MGHKFADIIIDITHENVDRPFTYAIPKELEEQVYPGCPVLVPFGAGNRKTLGYVIGLHDSTEVDGSRIKEITGIGRKEVSAVGDLMVLSAWMHVHYGCMMNQALKTVLPVKSKAGERQKRILRSRMTEEALREKAAEYGKTGQKARERLALALLKSPDRAIPYETALKELKSTAPVIRFLQNDGVLEVATAAEPERTFAGNRFQAESPVTLNEEQKEAVRIFTEDYDAGRREPFLLFGITGSGKTEVYMEMIRHVLAEGKQAILLIPEISLTYQTLERLRASFGERVAVINSKMSPGERYEQFKRANGGEADIMIGPRSAVFAPFKKLGLIIIDEEHDSAYKNDTVPRYRTSDVAEKRAAISGAAVVLGSATPSVRSWMKCREGKYRLLKLSHRASEGSKLAVTHIVDMRSELKAGNRTVFSRVLKDMIEDRLRKKEQIILFMNRRGYSNFVSCRSCGNAIRCPHCDVTLTLHSDGILYCHYCGYEMPLPEKCPSCGSPYIAGFGTGTQKLEKLTGKMFPEARILRMDADAAAKKNAGRDILSDFSEGKADILIGTQMVVKGHDVSNVTLVGIMAADTELYVSSYESAERTFQLLTQAAGRAGRGSVGGDVVIQTYRPDHYAVAAAAGQDYASFVEHEMSYREVGSYPPYMHILTVQIASRDEKRLLQEAAVYAELLKNAAKTAGEANVQVIGPVKAGIYKIHDYYRKLIYIKHTTYDILLRIKNEAENVYKTSAPEGISLLYDFE